MLQSIAPNEVHLWLANPSEFENSPSLQRLSACLSREETARMMRYYFQKNRTEYLVGRAGIRHVLSTLTGVEPGTWKFQDGQWGRPELPAESPFSGFRFNLSHTDNLLALAFARDRDVGVDVEFTGREGQTVKIADRYFSLTEIEELHSLPEDQQVSRFYDYWTLKEAYIKARGMGLAIPLRKFSFVFLANELKFLRVDSDLGDDGATWQLHLSSPSPVHRLAMCVRNAAAQPLTIVRHELATVF